MSLAMLSSSLIFFQHTRTHTHTQGGNDYEIYMDERTIGHKVTSPEDTMSQLKELFFKD